MFHTVPASLKERAAELIKKHMKAVDCLADALPESNHLSGEAANRILSENTQKNGLSQRIIIMPKTKNAVLETERRLNGIF